MKKNIVKIAASAAFTMMMLASCATINSGAALGEKGPVGPKMGEAKSTIYFGLCSENGEQNNIQKAAQNGGIKKVSQVEYIDQSIFFGLIIKHTTRVYGE